MINYELLNISEAFKIKELCNELMMYQKKLSSITPERFDSMSFETRFLPSLEKASENFILLATSDDLPVGYVYCNISTKKVYDSDFATFFDMDSVDDEVGCLSQFYIKEGFRNKGIGSRLFDEGMKWLSSYDLKDLFIFVSNENDYALEFYKNKGFNHSHDILDGFISVLRNS